VVQDQLLRDGAALGVAEHGGGVDAQVVAQVGNDHAMSGRELPDYWLEHLVGDHQPVHEQEGRPRSALGVVGVVKEL
jgi:hypothetical protein